MSVYVVRAKGTDLYKVGYTSRSAEKRIPSIQTGCPFELELVAEFLRAGEREEKAIHEALSEHNTSGEWFHLGAAEIWEIVFHAVNGGSRKLYDIAGQRRFEEKELCYEYKTRTKKYDRGINAIRESCKSKTPLYIVEGGTSPALRFVNKCHNQRFAVSVKSNFRRRALFCEDMWADLISESRGGIYDDIPFILVVGNGDEKGEEFVNTATSKKIKSFLDEMGIEAHGVVLPKGRMIDQLSYKSYGPKEPPYIIVEEILFGKTWSKTDAEVPA